MSNFAYHVAVAGVGYTLALVFLYAVGLRVRIERKGWWRR